METLKKTFLYGLFALVVLFPKEIVSNCSPGFRQPCYNATQSFNWISPTDTTVKCSLIFCPNGTLANGTAAGCLSVANYDTGVTRSNFCFGQWASYRCTSVTQQWSCNSQIKWNLFVNNVWVQNLTCSGSGVVETAIPFNVSGVYPCIVGPQSAPPDLNWVTPVSIIIILIVVCGWCYNGGSVPSCPDSNGGTQQQNVRFYETQQVTVVTSSAPINLPSDYQGHQFGSSLNG